jgi:hypothetical protein
MYCQSGRLASKETPEASEAGSYITGACLVVDGGTIVKTLQTNKGRTQLVAYLTNQGDIPLKHSKIKRRTL